MNLPTSNLQYQLNLPSTLPNDTNQEDHEELVVVTTEEPTPTPEVQRSTRVRQPVDPYGDFVSY